MTLSLSIVPHILGEETAEAPGASECISSSELTAEAWRIFGESTHLVVKL